MALEIKTIPLLKNKIALEFIKNSDTTYKNRSNSIDFSEQIKIMENILAKSKINSPI